MKTLLSSALALAVISGPVIGAEPSAPKRETNGNLKISFKLKAEELESAGNFVVQEATQANYVVGGDAPLRTQTAQGGGVEFKKHGTIVNCLAATNPNKTREVSLQCQFEISGPRRDKGPGGVLSFQFQTQVTIGKGRTTVLVDEPTRRVELTVEDFKP